VRGDLIEPNAFVSFFMGLETKTCTKIPLAAYGPAGNDNLAVIKISSIKSVVSMQPLHKADGDPDGLFFVVEKSMSN
jgi:hypothetical protein